MVNFLRNDSGSVPVEYALLAFLVAIGLIGAVVMIGDTLVGYFSAVQTGLQA